MDEQSYAGDLSDFSYRGARANILLHEEQLSLFLESWRRAKAAGVSLPKVDDPDYASPETLLRHVLRWARGYLKWICKQLALPDPGVDAVPEVEEIETEVGNYLDHLLQAWREPLRDVPQELISKQEYKAPWDVCYSVEAMLEHAVLHPYRHRFQLEELMGNQRLIRKNKR